MEQSALVKAQPFFVLGLVVVAAFVRITMAAGWLVLIEGLFSIPIFFILGVLGIFLVAKQTNRFPTGLAYGIWGLYLLMCLLAADISDENGYYSGGQFHSTENGEPMNWVGSIGMTTLWIRIGLLATLVVVYCYGCLDKKRTVSKPVIAQSMQVPIVETQKT